MTDKSKHSVHYVTVSPSGKSKFHRHDKTTRARFRHYHIRYRLIERHGLGNLPKDAREKELARLVAAYDAPKKFRVRFGANQQRRESFLLYKKFLHEHASKLRAIGGYANRRNAEKLDAYCRTLVDVAPRDTEFYDDVWELISAALRGHGSKRAKSIYEWTKAHRDLIEGEIV
jgi:hypothetical protein